MNSLFKNLPHKLVNAALITAFVVASPVAISKTLELRYAHMNSPTSIAGQQAQMFADKVKEFTNGDVNIKVYPSSQLGKMQEMAEATSTGVIALSHNTAGGTGSLHEPFAALDSPYLYRNVEHLMKVTDKDSPVMKTLSDGLIKEARVRPLYAYYFGTRNLTANKSVHKPEDLASIKIRALPFPIYMTAVESLGAVPVPVDWSEVPTALATGQVSGQENPVDVVLSSKLYESQSDLMMTRHIINPQVIIMNERVWQGLSDEHKAAFEKAAEQTRQAATEMVLSQEAEQLVELKKLGMNVIDVEDGLAIDEFRARADKLVKERFGDKFGDLYEQIANIE